MVLIERRVERIGEHERRRRGLVRQDRLHLRGLRRHRRRVGAGLREPQIDQLEHRLQVLARAAAAQPFLELADEWIGRGDLAGHHLPEIEDAELADAAGGDELRRGAGRDVILVARERGAAGAARGEQDLVLLERRRLQHDLDAVRQLPLGDADRVLRRGARHGAAGRRRIEERRRGRGVDVRLQLLLFRLAHHARQLRLVGQHESGLVRRAQDDDTVVVREPLARQLVDLVEGDRRQQPLVQRVLVLGGGQRLIGEEVADVLVGAAGRDAGVALGHHPLVAAQDVDLLAL